jgi:MFS family permease
VPHTKLTSAQITGFWGAWSGRTLDGMDSFIYALVLSPALSELLPKSGYAKTPANVGLAGSVLFALFLVGWGLSFMWGPIAERFGRTRVLAATILCGVYRRSSVGPECVAIGGVWVAGGDRHRRRVGPGRNVCRGSVAGGPAKNGRWIFADRLLLWFFSRCGAELYGRGALRMARDVSLRLVAGGYSVLILARVKEPERWKEKASQSRRWGSSLAEIFAAKYRRKTIVNAALLTVAIIGLWAGAVYEPTAIITLAKKVGLLIIPFAQETRGQSLPS